MYQNHPQRFIKSIRIPQNHISKLDVDAAFENTIKMNGFLNRLA